MYDYTLINDDKSLRTQINNWKENNINILAMDFEGESNLHCYGEHLCLIQLYDNLNFFIIDPFEISKELLIEFMCDSYFEKIMFACTGDCALFRKLYNKQIVNIYDVRIPALELGFEKGYAALVERNLNTSINIVGSKKKNQMTNWMNRPLATTQIQYALEDVAYLFKLKDSLVKEITQKKLGQRVDKLMKSAGLPKSLPVPGYEKFWQKKMKYHQREYIKIIYLARDEVARKFNLPPDRVLQKKQLIYLSSILPNVSNEQLRKIIKNKNPKVTTAFLPVLQKGLRSFK